MMTRYCTAILTFFLFTYSGSVTSALADPWNLPSTLNEANTQISFQVDSNMYAIKGRTEKLKGTAWLADRDNPFSVTSEVVLPVSALLTPDDSDNDIFHAMMDKDHFPEVKVKIHGTGQHCSPEQVNKAPCHTTMQTQVIIKDNSRMMSIPVSLHKRNNSYIITGQHSFEWASFGIEDHSPFLVILDPHVDISFRIELPPLPLG